MLKHYGIEVHWLKHSGFKIKTKDGVIYIDPFHLNGEMEKADVLFISHGHYDHLDENSIRLIIKPETTVFCSQDAPEKIADLGKVEAIHPMHPHEEQVFGHLKVTTYPAYNTDKPYHPKEAGGLGFLIELEKTKIYFAGDTDPHEELESIQCDIALLPVSGIYVMGPEQAAELANKIKPTLVAIPMHFGELVDDQNRKVGTLEDAEKFCNFCQVNTQILKPSA